MFVPGLIKPQPKSVSTTLISKSILSTLNSAIAFQTSPNQTLPWSFLYCICSGVGKQS